MHLLWSDAAISVARRFSLTAGHLAEVLRVSALLQHQSQRRLADRLPRRSLGSGEEVGVVLRDEAGAHVPSLELRVARQTQQEVDVGVQSHDLNVVRKEQLLVLESGRRWTKT